MLQIEKNQYDGLLLHFTIFNSDMEEEEETPESNIRDVFKTAILVLNCKNMAKTTTRVPIRRKYMREFILSSGELSKITIWWRHHIEKYLPGIYNFCNENWKNKIRTEKYN